MDGLIICLLVVIIALQVFFRPRKDHSDIAGELKRLLDEMQRSFERIEKNFREDFRLNREEGRIVARDNREELVHLQRRLFCTTHYFYLLILKNA